MDEIIVGLTQATIEQLIAFADQRGFDRNEIVKKVGVLLYTAGQVGDFTNFRAGGDPH